MICDEAGIPTAAYARFTDAAAAKTYVAEQGAPIVVKYDGLMAGKGVVVAESVAEAEAAIDQMLTARATASSSRSFWRVRKQASSAFRMAKRCCHWLPRKTTSACLMGIGVRTPAAWALTHPRR